MRALLPNWPAAARLALLVCAFLLSPAALMADEVYIVKKGDTVSGIAQKTGVPAKDIAEKNGLNRSYHIYAGQKLLLRKVPKAPAFSLPATVQQAINKARVKPGRWKYIVIHHSGADSGTVAGMDHYHRKVRHMENGLAYHFVIGNGNGMRDGEIAVAPRWTRQLAGGHLASENQNFIALGICLVGNFDQSRPTAAQLKNLRGLVQALRTRCKLPVSAVQTHREINTIGTRCPGSRFPEKTFKASLAS
jgi:LysM repeat protein